MTQAETGSNTRGQKVLLQLPAGFDAEGKKVVEQVEAWLLDSPNHYELVRSPLFLRNLAAGDFFTVASEAPEDIKVLKRSGKLCLKVFREEGIDEIDMRLTPEVEKLDGSLDLKTEHALVYSLHVNIGFGEIERLFDGIMAEFRDSVWYYGNIYDPRDGTTPLNWWDDFLNQV